MLRRQHIFAGSYYVGRTQPLILEAYLGTCVAVALYDEAAGIGGLIHLLLPEPVSPEEPLEALKYASTGFPIFLKSLCDAGAAPGRLKACVAGGALVAPLNDFDLELDIGGRTAERVLQSIEDERIKIEKSETGGLFSCRLSVDMRAWNCRIDPAGVDIPEAGAEPDPPVPGRINRVIKDLKPIPQIALKILRILDDRDCAIDELAAEIRKDQVISARALQLCNSAMFSTRKRIHSVDHAVVMLGQNFLLKYVVCASINSFFIQCGRGYSLCKGGLFHHAVGTAVLAEQLAVQAGTVSPSVAYTAGLLHDIGKVALDQSVADRLPHFYRRLCEENQDLLQIEKKILGIDHTEVGGKLAGFYSLPEPIVDAVCNHHHPWKSLRNRELVHIVHLADFLMSRFNTCFELERIDAQSLGTSLEAAGFSADQFPALVDLLPSRTISPSPKFAPAGTVN